MPKIKHNLSAKMKRQLRVRSKLHGTAKCPRLNVFRSNQYFYLQAIDDDRGLTIVAVNDAGKEKKFKGTKTEKAQQIAQDIATQLQAKKITQLVFDRGHCRYHGLVKAAAEVLREAGLKL
ncbi:50S ribosomal protein L18 [Patescibacteria group bacterium]|nr:50S ribosomal protein L18 [Patescibacteria group bacterium]MBU1966922.1 50S ribosomal protein L18 [Patescibacteria group bacterium]MBU2543730.1 50S ribosomal protein L18 [Patescibacteria group bacterium]